MDGIEGGLLPLYCILLQIVIVGVVTELHVMPFGLVRIIPVVDVLLVPTAINCVPVQITSYPMPPTPKEDPAATVQAVPELLYMRVKFPEPHATKVPEPLDARPLHDPENPLASAVQVPFASVVERTIVPTLYPASHVVDPFVAIQLAVVLAELVPIPLNDVPFCVNMSPFVKPPVATPAITAYVVLDAIP